MNEASVELPGVGGANVDPPLDSKNPIPRTEVRTTASNDSPANTPVVAGDSSPGEPAASANPLATDNAPVARIKTDPPVPVSAVEQIPGADGANSNQTPRWCCLSDRS